MYSLILLTVSSFLLSLLLTPVVRNLSIRRGWVDRPDGGRKSHLVAIPRTGGVAIVLACAGAFVILRLIGLRGGHLADLEMVSRLGPAVLVIFAVGLIDDLYGLTVWQKLVGQLLAAGIAFGSGVQLHMIGYQPLPDWLSLPATLVWLIMITNAVNLIDGMDGLATGVALFATITMLAAGLQQNNMGLALAVVPLAGALLGFLRYNFNPATVFLGDCGSLTIGFVLGCFGVFWSQKSATMLGVTAPLMALAIPLLDSLLAVVRRFLRRQSIFDADRGHVHHRLLAKGLTVRQAALLLYGVSLVFAILSLLSSMLMDSYAGIVLVLFCAMTWMGVQSLGYVEIDMAGRMILAGGFRRMLGGQLIIRSFQEKLVAAHELIDIWQVLRDASRELGFDCIEMQLSGQLYSERLHKSDGKDTVWKAEIPLVGGDYVRLTRSFDERTHQSAVGPFLDVMRKGLTEKKLAHNSERLARAAGA